MCWNVCDETRVAIRTLKHVRMCELKYVCAKKNQLQCLQSVYINECVDGALDGKGNSDEVNDCKKAAQMLIQKAMKENANDFHGGGKGQGR